MPTTARGLRRLGIALAATCAGACALATAPGAHAVNLLTCPAGASTQSWSPALTNTPTMVAISATVNYGTCVALSPPLTRTGGWSGSLPPSLRTCTDLLQSRTGQSHPIHWSTGTTSTVTVDILAEYITGGIVQITESGIVTSGDFAGGHYTSVVAIVGADPLTCGSTGVGGATGPTTMIITP